MAKKISAKDAAKMLTVGTQYRLVTYDLDGDIKPEAEWGLATWNGTDLIDAGGQTWTEWLEDIFDIVEVK